MSGVRLFAKWFEKALFKTCFLNKENSVLITAWKEYIFINANLLMDIANQIEILFLVPFLYQASSCKSMEEEDYHGFPTLSSATFIVWYRVLVRHLKLLCN